MYAPYYFNSYMSFQMTGVTNILVGPGNPETLYPDAGKVIAQSCHQKLVYNHWTNSKQIYRSLEGVFFFFFFLLGGFTYKKLDCLVMNLLNSQKIDKNGELTMLN